MPMSFEIIDENGIAWTLPLPARFEQDLAAYRALSQLTRALLRAETAYERERESAALLMPENTVMAFDRLLDCAKQLASAVDEHFDA